MCWIDCLLWYQHREFLAKGSKDKALDQALVSEKAAFIEALLARHAEASRPLRLCVVLPRLADVGDLRRAICQAHLYNTPSTATATTANTNITASGITYNAGSVAGMGAGGLPFVPSPGPPSPQRLTLLDCYPPGGLIRSVLDDRESVLQVRPYDSS